MEEFATQVEINFKLDTKEIALALFALIDEEIDQKLPDNIYVNDLDDEFKKSVYRKVLKKAIEQLY